MNKFFKFQGIFLSRGWVIANHKLVSFNVAFISSILSVPLGISGRVETLRFIFFSWETIISLIILYLSWHIGIAVHETGHFVTAARLNALNPSSQEKAEKTRKRPFLGKMVWYTGMFLKIPWGRFYGVKKDNGNFTPDAPYNLAVSASGPIWSGYLAAIALPIGVVNIVLGLILKIDLLTYIGRFFLAPGVVGLLDRFLADRGKLAEHREREKQAAQRSGEVSRKAERVEWISGVAKIREKLLSTRMSSVKVKESGVVSAPWQFRNCGMGGRHTEKEYPESNISMQEGMFIPLSAKTYDEAQEMTVRLQSRLKEIIESAPGARVMGIGLEGGLVPYIDTEPGDRVPEQRLWRMMKKAITDCGYEPGVDVAIALDPAASELENAYREENEQPEAVGMYRFWRDKSKVDMSRDEILELYRDAMKEGIPILSIEDGFGELDHEGWKLLMSGLPEQGIDGFGDKIFVIGDDLVTTKDESIEKCAKNGEINASLIKANQIGTLSETVLAMLTSLAYGADLVVSHRSKSPNDPFEAEIAVAMNALGLKAGGGSNTERLQKYGRVSEILSLAQISGEKLNKEDKRHVKEYLEEMASEITGRKDIEIDSSISEQDIASLMIKMLAVGGIIGNEESTNAGIPTASATIILGRSGVVRFKGSTPLGTSAGIDEAVHYVDSMIEPSETTKKYPELFERQENGTYKFASRIRERDIRSKNDEELLSIWETASRYNGKGCIKVVKHIEDIIADVFKGKKIKELGGILDIDKKLMELEKKKAIDQGRLSESASFDQQVKAMQRKSVLGMNAILSVSLALGRAVAASDGKELWQLIRTEAVNVMSGFICEHSDDYKKGDEEKLRSMDFDKLKDLFGKEAKKVIDKNEDIYPLLRKKLPVYGEK